MYQSTLLGWKKIRSYVSEGSTYRCSVLLYLLVRDGGDVVWDSRGDEGLHTDIKVPKYLPPLLHPGAGVRATSMIGLIASIFMPK